jgi:PST family polysaccharide transporter
MSQNQESDQSESAEDSEKYFRTDHLTAAIGGRTARGGLVTMLSHALKFAVSIVATAILARLLTPNDYGLIAMVAVTTGFVSMFKDLGLSLATVQKAEVNYNQVSTLFWVNVATSGLIFILMASAAPGVAWFFDEPRLTAITIVTASGFLLGGLTVQHEALLKRQMQFFALSVIAFVSMVAGYTVGIALAWSGVDYWALVFSQLALLATNMAGVWLACRWRPGPPKRNCGVRSMLSFGGRITGYSTINYFSKNLDSLLIGRFWGAQQLGFYNRAVQLASLPTDQINEPLSSVVIPALSRLAQEPARYRLGYLRIMEKVLLVTMPAVTLMIVTSDWLVYLVLGNQWTMAANILVFIGISGLFQPIANTGGWLLVTQGRAQHMLLWSIINAPVSVISILVGLHWGAVGVAASYSLGKLLIMNPLLYWFVGRSGPVRTRDFYRLLGPFVLASGAATLACLAFRLLSITTDPLVGFVICGALTLAAFTLCLWVTPTGRAALLDMKESILLLKPVPRSVNLAAQD